MIAVCRYCGCTESTPCVTQGIPCAWLLEDVCDAPPCVEKAYRDARHQADRLTELLETGDADRVRGADVKTGFPARPPGKFGDGKEVAEHTTEAIVRFAG